MKERFFSGRSIAGGGGEGLGGGGKPGLVDLGVDAPVVGGVGFEQVLSGASRGRSEDRGGVGQAMDGGVGAEIWLGVVFDLLAINQIDVCAGGIPLEGSSDFGSAVEVEAIADGSGWIGWVGEAGGAG